MTYVIIYNDSGCGEDFQERPDKEGAKEFIKEILEEGFLSIDDIVLYEAKEITFIVTTKELSVDF